MKNPLPKSSLPKSPSNRKIRIPSLPTPPHPGLIPGIGVEQTGVRFGTNWLVLSVTVALTLAVILWAFIAPTIWRRWAARRSLG
ncbi:hypothetical protein [Leucobacter insecticola]|uniref:hypothetical protein n=1 Tax=Leucobacter insecticola TaxID=2714934 RepID=UPI001FCC39C2|nr:hypothetical protein [Leucobacter insecticola]